MISIKKLSSRKDWESRVSREQLRILEIEIMLYIQSLIDMEHILDIDTISKSFEDYIFLKIL